MIYAFDSSMFLLSYKYKFINIKNIFYRIKEKNDLIINIKSLNNEKEHLENFVRKIWRFEEIFRKKIIDNLISNFTTININMNSFDK